MQHGSRPSGFAYISDHRRSCSLRMLSCQEYTSALKQQGLYPGTPSVAAHARTSMTTVFMDLLWMQVMVSRTHTGSMSAFAAFAAQVSNEPESPPALSLQPILTRVAQLQPGQDPIKAKAAPVHKLLEDLRRAATAPHIAPAAGRISPWAAMDAPASASAGSVAAPLTVATVSCQCPEPAPFCPPSKEEHRAQLVQLLEDACRQASHSCHAA